MAQEYAPDGKNRQDDSEEITIEEMAAAEQDPNHPLQDPNNPRHQDFLEAQNTALEVTSRGMGATGGVSAFEGIYQTLREQSLGKVGINPLKHFSLDASSAQSAQWKAYTQDPFGVADRMRKFSADMTRQLKLPAIARLESLTQSISPNIQNPGFNKLFEISKPCYRMPLPVINYTALLDGILRNSSAIELSDSYNQVIEQSRQKLADLFKLLESQDLVDEQHHLPPNLQGMVGSRRKLEQLLLDEGLALAYVPDVEVLEAILDATSADERRDVILQNSEGIACGCSELLSALDAPYLQEKVFFAKCIAVALLAGHDEAAQALAANLLDSMLREKRDGKANISKMKRKQRPPLTRGKQITESIVMAGLWGAFGTYRPDKSDEIPTIFSRHASAHGVSRRQYSKVNAVIALMHVVAYLCWLQHREEYSGTA